jgi:hypothetical protein
MQTRYTDMLLTIRTVRDRLSVALEAAECGRVHISVEKLDIAAHYLREQLRKERSTNV